MPCLTRNIEQKSHETLEIVDLALKWLRSGYGIKLQKEQECCFQPVAVVRAAPHAELQFHGCSTISSRVTRLASVPITSSAETLTKLKLSPVGLR